MIGTPQIPTPVSIANGGTARATKFPYTILGAAAAPFATTLNNGFAFEKITGLLFSSGTNVWASDAWTAPEAGLVEIHFNCTCDGFTNLRLDIFSNGSSKAALNREAEGFLIGRATVVVAANDVLDFRVSSNEASANIYVNSNPNVGFIYMPNY